MAFAAKILAASQNPDDQCITTVELTYPRFIHSEFMTHRAFARNAASSRAIPVQKMIDRVVEEPVVPIHWGLNQSGMQAFEEMSSQIQLDCRYHWLRSRDRAVEAVKNLLSNNLHKQIANRLLEPWMWITVIATGNAPAFENFFKLRCHKDAEPHIQKIAYMLRDEYDSREIQQLDWMDYHLPLVGFDGDDSLTPVEQVQVSAARCARVSYLTHDGQRDVSADLKLHDRLSKSGHWSPFEHVAQAMRRGNGGNLGAGWQQYRKCFANECCNAAPRD